MIVVLSFWFIQSHFGSYDFTREYLQISLFRKVMAPGARMFWMPFYLKLFQTHAIHVLLALIGCVMAIRKSGVPRSAIIVGAV